jgi:hypothetical protein
MLQEALLVLPKEPLLEVVLALVRKTKAFEINAPAKDDSEMSIITRYAVAKNIVGEGACTCIVEVECW